MSASPTAVGLAAAAVGLVAGLVLGVAFFEGLRWTVERIPTSRRPALLVTSSFVLRVAVLGAALALLTRAGGWLAAVAATAGILLARGAVLRRAPGGGGGPWT